MVDTEALFRIGDAAQEDGKLDFARHPFERGATLGDVECLTRLAYMHDVGIGTDIDKQLAMILYQRAWRIARSVVAATNIAILYRERGNYRAMFTWYQRAAGEGDGSALFDMAKCYLDGIGVRANPQAGLRCLASAIRSIYITEAEREQAVALMSNLAPRPIEQSLITL